MIPHTSPPVWPDPGPRPGRAAAAFVLNSPELWEERDVLETIGKCKVGLIGLADDTGVEMNHGRVGARRGPHAFRAALARYGAAHPADAEGAGPAHPFPRVFDAGDVITGVDIHDTHDRVTDAVARLLELGLFPIAIGGGHDLTYPFVRAVARAHGVMEGVYLDAHLDVRAEVGSGMPFRRLIEDRLVDRLSVFGLDPLANSGEHLEWFRAHGGRVASWAGAAIASGSLPWASRTDARPESCFVSLDLDVLDAAFAPGVSAMNPCGLTPRAVGDVVHDAGRARAVRCFDIMELNPEHDEQGRTARLAAHLFLRFLRGLAERETGGGAGGSRSGA